MGGYMTAKRLDDEIIQLIKKSWKALINLYDEKIEHWSDNEKEGGFLKDVDVINTLIDTYMLTPTSFVDPPMPPQKIYDHVDRLLKSISQDAKDINSAGHKYRGFTSQPYPYLPNTDFDFVDSASSTLQLICNTLDLSEQCKAPIPSDLSKLMNDIAKSAIEFLLESKIDDRDGCRWQGTAIKTDPPGKYANMMFTYYAALSLHKALQNKKLSDSLDNKTLFQDINSTLTRVPRWILGKYKKDSRFFWIGDTGRSAEPVAVIYAIETLYTIYGDKVPDNVLEICREAVCELLGQMTELRKISAMQSEFTHVVPIPSMTPREATLLYDDRRYVAAFFTAFTLMRIQDPAIVDEQFYKVLDLLYKGVTDEWLDEDTEFLWDDGRPLICYSSDAMKGLILYGLEGRVPTVTLREDELRDAVTKAFASREVIDEIVTIIMKKASAIKEQELGRSFKTQL